jgi:hypothetical protein
VRLSYPSDDHELGRGVGPGGGTHATA